MLLLCKSQSDDCHLWAEYYKLKADYFRLVNAQKLDYNNLIQRRFAAIKCTSEFWSAVNSVRRTLCPKHNISASRWEEFYKAVYSPRPLAYAPSNGLLIPSLDNEISLEELLISLNKCKTHKAAGYDSVSYEFFKELPENWIQFLLSTFNRIMMSEEVLSDWSMIIMCMILRKGDPKLPENYRGIALMNSLVEIFTQILAARIQMGSKISFDSRRTSWRPSKKGCEDSVFCILAALQIAVRFKVIPAYVLSVDFKRAFDTVPHDMLWVKMIKLGLSAKLVNILKSLYKGTIMQIKSSDSLSSPIDVTMGVLQGEILSPLLFILYIVDLITFFEEHGLNGLNLGPTYDLLALEYADDLALPTRTAISLHKLLKVLEIYCDMNGLTVNVSKTKILRVSSSGRSGKRDEVFLLQR